MGCKLPIRHQDARFACCFYSVGFCFEENTAKAVPCFSSYHLGCIRLGSPFRTRLQNSDGLSMPSAPDLPNFICEACTVRAVLDRELQDTPQDRTLLMLERARLVDIAHNWSASTHAKYQGKLRIVRGFERSFGVSILRPTPLERPPRTPAIPIMWVQQQYALRVGRARGTNEAGPLAFATVRSLRSAVTQFHSWDLQVSQPERAMQDMSKRPVLTAGCVPSDTLAYTFMTAGMSRRLGDSSKPSTALLHRHIQYLDEWLELQFTGARSPVHQAELCRAALANLFAWIGWLRATENFSLGWADIEVTEPEDGPRLELPKGAGAISLRLLAQTKSNRTQTADMIIAYTTASGLSTGKWIHRLRASLGYTGDSSWPTGRVFQHPDGSKWTSAYFRVNYLLPSLHMQRMAGDPHLAPYDGSTPGNSLEDKFWSMHSYRRGGRTHVSKKRLGCFRKATPQEVEEHGRWRLKRSSLDMPTLYLEWTVFDRIAITLFCM